MPEIKFDIGDITGLMREAWDNSEVHGFHEPISRDGVVRDASVGERLLLTVEELIEAWSHYRDGRDITEIFEVEKADGTTKPDGFPIEMADAVIRLAEMCEHYGIPLQEALVIKTEFNRGRPFRHGRII